MTNTLMTFNEAKDYLRVKEATLYKLARGGMIPASKVGRQWRFRKERVDKWLYQQEIAYNKNKKK